MSTYNAVRLVKGRQNPLEEPLQKNNNPDLFLEQTYKTLVFCHDFGYITK